MVRKTRQRLRVNPIACEAHGVCLELLPELLGTDPWGYPVVSERPVPDRLLGHARRAVASCPTLALLLVEDTEAAPTKDATRRQQTRVDQQRTTPDDNRPHQTRPRNRPDTAALTQEVSTHGGPAIMTRWRTT